MGFKRPQVRFLSLRPKMRVAFAALIFCRSGKSRKRLLNLSSARALEWGNSSDYRQSTVCGAIFSQMRRYHPWQYVYYCRRVLPCLWQNLISAARTFSQSSSLRPQVRFLSLRPKIVDFISDFSFAKICVKRRVRLFYRFAKKLKIADKIFGFKCLFFRKYDQRRCQGVKIRCQMRP